MTTAPSAKGGPVWEMRWQPGAPGRKGRGREGRRPETLAPRLYRLVQGGSRRVGLDLGPKRHILQAPPCVALRQGRSQNKVQGIGIVPVQLDAPGPEFTCLVKLGKSRSKNSRPSGRTGSEGLGAARTVDSTGLPRLERFHRPIPEMHWEGTWEGTRLQRPQSC